MELAASAAAFVSLSFQLFNGCIKGFVLLTNAQGLGSKAETLVAHLQWEQYRLVTWAGLVGLLNDPPELNVRDPLGGKLVQNTIANLEQLLINVEKIRKDYGLNIEVTDEEVDEVNKPKRGLGKLLARARPSLINNAAKVYRARNGAWSKLKWSAFDAAKFGLLLQDVRTFNDRLESLLHPSDKLLASSDQGQALRAIVSLTPDKALLEYINGALSSVDSGVAASARLKSLLYKLDLIHPEEEHLLTSSPAARSSLPSTKEINVTARDIRKSSRQLSRYHGYGDAEVTRETACFDNDTVVLEWKQVTVEMEHQLKHRIARVATFLAEMGDPTFHSLQCIGYVKFSSTRYAYIFKPPSHAQDSVSLSTLKELMTRRTPRPSLNHRISAAFDLAETVMQLHTAGWLHKDIRPENVLYFNSKANLYDQGAMWQTYLGGYSFARANNPLETTEDPHSKDFSDLYRHPSSLGSQRPPYGKKFDLYSLGCVLIELALWEPLPDIMWRHHLSNPGAVGSNTAGPDTGDSVFSVTSTAKKQTLLQKRSSLLLDQGHDGIMAEVGYQVGTAYAEVVGLCTSKNKGESQAEEEQASSAVELEETLVYRLAKLKDNI